MKYSIFRVVSYASKNFIRNIGLSVMTVTILVLALLSINTIIVLNGLTDASLAAFEKQVDVSIDFHPDAPDDLVDEVTNTITHMPEVKETTFLTADEVKEQFKERHADNDNILSALNALDHNPFGASLFIEARDSQDYTKILGLIDTDEYNSVIEKKSLGEHAKVIGNIQRVTNNISQAATFFAVIFGLFSIFIIFNTIRVALYSKREEIGIMRLVGASKWFIRAPFYMECFMYVIVALIVSISLTVFILEIIDPFIRQTFLTTGFSILVDVKQRIGGILIFEFIAVFLMTLIAASIAMRKYLKV